MKETTLELLVALYNDYSKLHKILPKTLKVGVNEANEIIRFQSHSKKVGFEMIKELFRLEKIEVVLKDTWMEFS